MLRDKIVSAHHALELEMHEACLERKPDHKVTSVELIGEIIDQFHQNNADKTKDANKRHIYLEDLEKHEFELVLSQVTRDSQVMSSYSITLCGANCAASILEIKFHIVSLKFASYLFINLSQMIQILV